MNRLDLASTPPPPTTSAGEPTTTTTKSIMQTRTKEIMELLGRAAELCAAEGVEQDAFMTAAWAAYLDASPGLREALADKELVTQLQTLRQRGLIGTA